MMINPISHPKIVTVASVLMGALTIAMFVMRPGKGELPGYQSGLEHREASVSGAPDSGPSRAQVSGRVIADSQSDAVVAQVLDAVRTSLQRNDLASAKVLLGAEQALYKDDKRVLDLQRELQAREAMADHARSVERAVNAPDTSESPLSASRSAARGHRTHEASLPVHKRTTGASSYAVNPRAPEMAGTANQVVSAEAARPVAASAETASTSQGAATAAAGTPMVSQTVPLILPAVQPAQAAQPAQAEQTAQAAQTFQPEPTPAPTPTQSSQGAKTRAQVRMELERARANGALPRFGNPDPAGPGGAPSLTVNPMPVAW
jgi:hypothetical protein